MTAPLLPLATSFAVGTWLGLVAAMPGWLPGAGLGLGALVWLAAARGRHVTASAGVLLLAALAGWARTALPDPLPPTGGLREGPVRVDGLVGGDPQADGPRTRVPLVLERVTAERGPEPAFGVLLSDFYGPLPALRAGERIRATLTLGVPRPFRNPGDGPWGPPIAPRAPRYVATGRGDSVERLPAAPLPWWLRVRLWVHAVVQRELPPVSGALLEGLLIGERRQLPPTLLADFRSAGVFHVLAISGFNVGLIVGGAFFLLRVLRVPSRSAALAALGTLGAFVLVVGAQASVLRATVMGALVLAARLVDRETSVWNSLAAALIVLLALDPAALVDPGLQLSFGATAGILHLGPPIRRRLAAWAPRPLADAVAVSLGAQLGVTPVMLALWNQLSLAGVVANLVVVPLAVALTMLGCLGLALATASQGVAHLVFQSLWALLLALRIVVRAFAAIPGALLHVPTPPFPALAAAVAGLVLLPLAGHRLARALVGALLGSAVLATVAGYRADGRLHVLVLDVGQGDAILVRGPDGQTLLVDTGAGGPGRLDRAKRVILPVLHRLGVTRLSALAVTHGDPDHAGGLATLLAGIPVEEVWVPAGTAAEPEEPWQQPIGAAGVPRRSLARGERRWIGPLLVSVLNPPAGGAAGPIDRRRTNNGSLVLRVEWGLAAAILTGDAEARAEEDMATAGEPVAAPVLKVGHHGSWYGSSPGFLRAVGPAVAAISVGPRNPFGHPSPAVLARLEAAGATSYRTDTDGAIEITSDAERVWVRRWARPEPPREILLLRGAP